MIDSLFLFVAAAEGAGEELGAVASLARQFGVDWRFLIAQIVNFCLVAFILYRFAFKPVLNTIEDRQKKIADGLQYAEEMKSKLEEAEKKEAETLKKAHQEAQVIVQETRESAKVMLEKQSKDAAEKAEDILKRAEQTIEMERTRMLSDVRQEIASLVVQVAAKVLRRELPEEERTRYNEAASKELASVE
ncbi:MAG: ATP synthase subunit b [Candidatus Moanabacter tarae]|uniref:ATP synthase subunit b n=1 Tax=Candidatus Moanibacter tarae TaxID=2200854 RepID=A0A2Z4AHQ1_9BACT|nr:MAG: ATP synthase subunit b [Candidatus Moanabacter tarae]|tara:strand:- start:24067 stop:24636 length:570 start_codon:yes stop_codon:yes gene_type:complete